MYDDNFDNSLPAGKFRWVKTIAMLSMAMGLIVLCGWALHIDTLKQLLTGLVSMKANTAAAFFLCGACLYMHTLKQLSPIALMTRRMCSFLVLLLGLTTMCEYLFGWNAGIDQLLFKEPAGAMLTSHPGRMSNITAINFILVGGALLLMEARLWMAVQATVFAVIALTLLSFGVYMIGSLSLLYFGDATYIAAHTVISFLVLAAGILIATRNQGFLLRLRERFQTLGLAVALFLLASIFGAASYNFMQKDKASEWVEHTFEVIVCMESFMDSMHDYLYHNRGFLMTGDERQLAERNVRRSFMLRELDRVSKLTSDNPVQQERLAALNKLVAQRIELSDLVEQVRRENGYEAAAAMVASGSGDVMLDEIEAKLNEMETAEKDLLKQQQRIAEVTRSSSLFTLSVLLGTSLLLLLWVYIATRREISERKRSEELLLQSQKLTQEIIDGSSSLIYALDVDGRFIFANRKFISIFRIDHGQLIGNGRECLMMPKKIAEEHRNNDLEIMRSLNPVEFEENNVEEDGTHVYLSQKFPLLDLNGKCFGICGVSTDITGRKQAEEALRASEERLHSIIQNSMDAMVQMDDDGIITGWNSQMEKVFGWPQAEAIGRALHETIIPLPQRDVHVQGLKRFMHTGVGHVINRRNEVEGLHRNGNIFPVELSVISIKRGERYEFSAFLRDITERKRQENIQTARLRLMQSSARLSLKELLVATLDEACALTGSQIGFYHFLDSDQKTLSLQAWSTRTTGEFCKAEGEGSHYDIGEAGVWVDCVRERRPVIHNDYAALPHKRGMPPGHAHVEREMVAPIFRNELIVAILGVGNKAAPYDENDLESVTMLADIAWDIAVAKRATEDLYRLNVDLERRVVERTAQLETVNRDMEGFSYSVSHDLRAPLRAIDGFSRILLEDYAARLDDEGRRLLHVVGDNAQKMGELIDDILAFSRTTRQEVAHSEIDMKSMVMEIWEELKHEMAGRNVQLELRDMPPVEGDAAMLHQVIFNLLANAVKFTMHNAYACIEVGGQADEQENVYHVKDNGAGFDMQYADKLFGVFHRLHGMDEFEGTGIGLAIVKRIIAKHGGRVWAEGKVGEGAAFYFSLPKMQAIYQL